MLDPRLALAGGPGAGLLFSAGSESESESRHDMGSAMNNESRGAAIHEEGTWIWRGGNRYRFR